MSEEVLRRRLDQFETMRAFFIEMWLQNPTLAAQAGSRIQAMLRPLHSHEIARATIVRLGEAPPT